jgi:hypothetical protein
LVGPSGNAAPDVGVQDTDTGGAPPASAGDGKSIDVPLPTTPSTVASAGQVSAGAPGAGGGDGVGAVGVSLQPGSRPVQIASATA